MLDSNRLQRLQQAPLWDFALMFYARPGVEQACLVLQDQAGVDVCELLFHRWLYEYGLEAQLEALVSLRKERHGWQQRVTEPLRGLRRDLKPQASHSEAIATLRKTIQQAELQAECENLQRWQQWAWHISGQNQGLENSDRRAHFDEKWLQYRLFSRQDSASGQTALVTSEAVSAAWTMLVGEFNRA